MQTIVDPRQTPLFDPYEHIISTPVRGQLEQGWHAVFRHVVLELMPVEVLANARHETMGAPTKELYSVAGLLYIKEFMNWTQEQAVEQYNLNLGVHYALNLTPGGASMSARTLRRYLVIFYQCEAGMQIFDRVTAALVEALQTDIRKQRLDSTHIFSDMAIFGRTQLMGVAVKRFLTQLIRHDQAAYDELDEDLRKRYARSGNALFADTKRDKDSQRLLRQQVAEDMLALVQRFDGDEKHHGRKSYQCLKRIFFEQCDVEEEKVRVKDKGGSRVMQNPSDPDATYDGKKGPGYQVQIAETCADDNAVQLITGAQVQTAADTDAESFVIVLRQLKESDRLPVSILADAAYGSDANVQAAAVEEVELISPVNTAKRDPEKLHAEDFTINRETHEVETCPAGHAPLDSAFDPETGRTTTHMDAQHCAQCPHQDRCPVKGAQTRTFYHTPAEHRRGERFQAEQDPAWRKQYAKRAGIEGLMGRLKRCMGLGRLRVRGQPAVSHATYLRLAGWNILQAAKAPGMREIVAKRVEEARRASETALGAAWLPLART